MRQEQGLSVVTEKEHPGRTVRLPEAEEGSSTGKECRVLLEQHTRKGWEKILRFNKKRAILPWFKKKKKAIINIL